MQQFKTSTIQKAKIKWKIILTEKKPHLVLRFLFSVHCVRILVLSIDKNVHFSESQY